MSVKLASGMHKPAQETIVPSSSVKDLLASLPVKKMKQLGGKLGNSLQADLGFNTVGDLLHFSKEKLQERYGVNTGTWLWNVARGISGEEVEGQLLPKSRGCGKTFPGPQALQTMLSRQGGQGVLLPCLCKRSFISNAMEEHYARQHSRLKVRCKRCLNQFKNKTELEIHKGVCSGRVN